MAYDEGLAQLFRDDLATAGAEEYREVSMFGGLCFMVRGHMVCGVHGMNGGGGMARVGKSRVATALEYADTQPMQMGARVMGGLVDMRGSAIEDDATRRALLAMALKNARSLPPRT